MNKRSITVASCVVLIATIALAWWLWPREPVPSAQPVTTAEGNLATPQASTLIPPKADIAQEKKMAEEKRQEKVRAIVEWRNVPISYYGKVVDQDETPIGGVKIHYSVQSLYALPVLPGAKSEFFDVVTDASGLFVIAGHTGSGIGIDTLTKEGYKYSAKAGRGALYSGNGERDYRPDAKSPEIFTMVQLGAAERLVKYDAHPTVPCDGTPVRINAMTGKATADGDLQITLKREPYNIVVGGPRFSWSVKIEVIGGGLVELVGTGTYRAPQEGYEREFVVEHPANAPEWGAGLRKVFYIKTRDERYGRININLDADYQPPPAKASLEVYMNPKPGSRNLEYDATKQASAH